MARLFPADISEIIRASNRDEEHINSITEIIIKNLKLYLNPRKILQYSYYAPVLAKIIYYSSTSLLKKQTLGEEYMNLIQVVSRSKRQLPSVFIHIIFIIFEGCSKLFEKYFSILTLPYYIKCKNYILLDEIVNDNEMIEYLSEWKDIIKNYLFPIIEKLHLSYFYLIDNNFYSLSKRLTNIKYFSLSSNTSIQIQKLLFYIGILNFIISFYLIFDGVYKIYIKYQEKRNYLPIKHTFSNTNQNKKLLEKYLEKSKFTCPLCLQISFPASTPCGHVYCFTCLTTGVLKENSKYTNKDRPLKCPQCRHQFAYIVSFIGNIKGENKICRYHGDCPKCEESYALRYCYQNECHCVERVPVYSDN
ncbi:Peroxisome biogenesis factor 10 [Strongyloides ratti]|uniref:RING-type E3 ubiquitin transferase n=1 Tax=Strongyloides ratti TaxID=34506 RepID=A0A090LB04_STRRB|nr:Peroxisome biogenesis factor 10 [Strongyloides ratti]CEF66942.1 Peroxisome biogenesis factor 10 [Strongyloides ratti]